MMDVDRSPQKCGAATASHWSAPDLGADHWLLITSRPLLCFVKISVRFYWCFFFVGVWSFLRCAMTDLGAIMHVCVGTCGIQETDYELSCRQSSVQLSRFGLKRRSSGLGRRACCVHSSLSHHIRNTPSSLPAAATASLPVCTSECVDLECLDWAPNQKGD